MAETLAQLIDRLARLRGLNHSSLSERAGLGRSAVRDIMRGKSRHPSFDTLSQLAAALDVPLESLTSVIAKPSKYLDQSAQSLRQDRTPATGVPAGGPLLGAPQGRTLPVFGRAQGGGDGALQMFEDERPFDWTYRPPQLATVENAYAIMMTGTSMEPRYEEGCLLWIHPGLPTPAGRDALIVLHDSRAFVKRVVRKTSTHLIVRQFGDDPKELPPIPMTEIRSIHRVVGSWDG